MIERSLSYLVDAVRGSLGEDLQDVFAEGFIERALNEGQARYEPDLYYRRRTVISIGVGDTQLTLPDDFAKTVKLVPSDRSSVFFPVFDIVQDTAYFQNPADVAWAGAMIYDAHFPEITDGEPCLLPPAAADGLISFALYRCFRQLAAGRSEYRAYATIVGNGVAMADLEQAASIHLQDFEESRVSASPLQEPVAAYEGED